MPKAIYKLEVTRWSPVDQDEWEPLEPEVVLERRFSSLERALNAAIRKATKVVKPAWDDPGDEFHFFVLDSETNEWRELNFPEVHVSSWSLMWPHNKKVTVRTRSKK